MLILAVQKNQSKAQWAYKRVFYACVKWKNEDPTQGDWVFVTSHA